MPKVAFILSPGKTVGGAEIYTIELAKSIQKEDNYTAYIFYSHNADIINLLEDNNILNDWLGSTLKQSGLKLEQLIVEHNIDIIHTSGYHSNFIVQHLLKNNPSIKRRIYLCCTEHGWINTNHFERLKTKYDLKSLPLFDTIFVVAPYMKQYLKATLGLNNVHFIPTSLSSKFEKYLIDSTQLVKNRKLLIGVGRLSEEKRFDLFLNVAHCLVQSDPLFHFVIVGEGEQRTKLEKYITKFNLEQNVTMTGFLQDPQTIYSHAEYLLITSETEGCPLVALEAMATETIVVASNVGTLENSLSESRGFLYNKDESASNIAMLLLAIDIMADSEKKTIIKAAKKYVARNHMPSRAVQMYLAEYKRLITWN